MSATNITKSVPSLEYKLALGALGIVFGDIGTSPLYAMHVALHGLPLRPENILGILSLIFWSLILVISIKYLIIVFKADNQGEGGILALLALLNQKESKYKHFFYLIAIFGAGLLLGDGMLTPAISISSAMEGLSIISPAFSKYVLPCSSVILILLFLIQHSGTAKLGAAFGPVILIWFITIAWLGFTQILQNPMVLAAVNPFYALNFLVLNGWQGYALLGGVFLVVTGGEALYADLGHFGENPIRRSWFFIVLPALLLNYFGQGAYLLLHPKAIANPFYMLAPDWFYVPLLIIATLATIIASQSVISAIFSLTRQAVLLGLYPKIPIIQTSKEHYGQIYIPQVNLLLFAGTLLLILTFKNSTGLAHAYGIAVNMDMLMITLLVAYTAHKLWHWSLPRTIIIFSLFLIIDLGFLGANLHKFLTGGWVPLVFATFVALIMYTWNSGLTYMKATYDVQEAEMRKFIKKIDYKCLHKIPHATSIFITDVYDMTGGSFLHFLKIIQTIPENILIVSYNIENIPYVEFQHRFQMISLGENIVQIILHYGFMDVISIPQSLFIANDRGLLPFPVNVDRAIFFIDIPNVVASQQKKSLWFYWQEKLFAFFMRNYSAHLNIEFYQLPPQRTVGIGTYTII